MGRGKVGRIDRLESQIENGIGTKKMSYEKVYE
jgi:hypothetical protein